MFSERFIRDAVGRGLVFVLRGTGEELIAVEFDGLYLVYLFCERG